MAEDRGFLSRWSERKLARRHGEAPDEDTEADAAGPTVDANPGEATQAQPGEPVGERVPHPAEEIDIETLTRDSDFTVFMQEGVPKAVRQKALRKLWTSDPVLANLDGLNDYEDMEKVYGIGPIGATAWKLGRGFLTDDETGLNAPAKEGGEATPEGAEPSAPEDAEPVVPEAEIAAEEDTDADAAADVAEAAPDGPGEDETRRG